MLKFLTIKVGFTLLIFLLIFLGLISLNKIDSISAQTKKIYDHPFKVSRSAISINLYLVSMHRYMKDVVLSKTEEELAIAIAQVNFFENKILNEYDVIFMRYLGDINDIKDSYHTFIKWKDIREEVIELVKQKRTDEAAFITKNKGAIHVALLNKKVQILVDFASTKADEFYNNAVKYDINTKKIIIAILIILILVSLFISKITIQNLMKNQKEKDKYLKKIEELSITDSLTTLYNRRYFDQIFKQELKTISRVDKKLIFIIFDIDNFKKYNDTYGHKAGDEVLKALSYQLKKQFKRESDHIFRIGGEEFALMFMIDDTFNTVALCNTVINSIRNLNIEHIGNEPFNKVTVSMGVGVIENRCKFKDTEIYEKVDKLLYDVKNSGKNMFKIEDIK